MKRYLASAVIAAASVISISAITVGTANSATGSTVGAAAHPSIRNYAYVVSITLTGEGKNAKFLDHTYRSQQVILAPAIAYYRIVRHNSISPSNKQVVFKGQYYLVGGQDYVELNGAKTWTITPATPAELRDDAVTLSPSKGLAKFRAIPGVTLAAPHQYQVTASPAKAGAFLTFEYGITARSLTSAGIKSVTITVLTDSAGRPLTYTVVAKSKLEKVSITETFTGYNQQLPITAPK